MRRMFILLVSVISIAAGVVVGACANCPERAQLAEGTYELSPRGESDIEAGTLADFAFPWAVVFVHHGPFASLGSTCSAARLPFHAAERQR